MSLSCPFPGDPDEDSLDLQEMDKTRVDGLHLFLSASQLEAHGLCRPAC